MIQIKQNQQNKTARWFPFLFALLLGLVCTQYRHIGYDFSYFPGDLGDARFNMYLLEHAYQWFCGEVKSFWSAPFMYPSENVIARSDNLLGSAPFYALFRMLGLDRFASFQSWFLLMAVFNFSAAFLLCKKLFKNPWAAALGAMVFAFSPALQSQVISAQTFPRFAIPLSLLMAVKFRENLSVRYFFGTILLVVYQIYCGVYLGFMLVIPIALFLIFTAISERKRIAIKNWRWYLGLLVGLVANVLILLPLMLPYYDNRREPTPGWYAEIFNNIAVYKSFFYSHPGSVAWPWLKHVGDKIHLFYMHWLFPGGIATLALLFMLSFEFYHLVKKPQVLKQINHYKHLLLISLTALLTFFFFTRWMNFSGYKWLYQLPGFSAMAALTRIINVLLVFYAVAVAFLFSLLLKSMKKYAIPIFLGLALLLTFDNFIRTEAMNRTSVKEAKSRITSLVATMKSLPKGSVISYEPLEMSENPLVYQLDAMHAAQDAGMRSVNGYSATAPGEFYPYWSNPSRETRNNWLNAAEARFDTVFVFTSPAEYQVVNWRNQLSASK